MIIVCTQDAAIINWTANGQSGANKWGNYLVINTNNQDHATTLLGNALNFLRRMNPYV